MVQEGEYNNYTRKWTGYSMPAAHGWANRESFVTSDESKTYIMTDGHVLLFNISDGSVTETAWAPEVYGGFTQVNHRSVKAKYIAILDSPYDNVFVFKNGVVIKQFSASTEGFDYWVTPIVSPSGKYILLLGATYTPSDRKWVCYEGSS